MDLTDAKAFINLVAAEYKRRADLLPKTTTARVTYRNMKDLCCTALGE